MKEEEYTNKTEILSSFAHTFPNRQRFALNRKTFFKLFTVQIKNLLIFLIFKNLDFVLKLKSTGTV